MGPVERESFLNLIGAVSRVREARLFENRCNNNIHHYILLVQTIPDCIDIPRAGSVLTQVLGLNKNRSSRKNTPAGGKGREDEAFNNHFEDLVGL